MENPEETKFILDSQKDPGVPKVSAVVDEDDKLPNLEGSEVMIS